MSDDRRLGGDSNNSQLNVLGSMTICDNKTATTNEGVVKNQYRASIVTVEGTRGCREIKRKSNAAVCGLRTVLSV